VDAANGGGKPQNRALQGLKNGVADSHYFKEELDPDPHLNDDRINTYFRVREYIPVKDQDHEKELKLRCT
jgi:hypothetical protein